MKNTLSAGSRRSVKCVKMPPAISKTANRRGRSRDNKRPHARILMRPWLETLLNNELCRGLTWIDKSCQIFSIVWRHASSSGFNTSEHSDVFYRWAKHTGKVKTESGSNHSNNKSNFRCALHSLKDCIELTAEGDKRGEGAKRTFQFIEPGHPRYDNKRKVKHAKKNKIQPKEEILTSTSDTGEQDTFVDFEQVVTGQDTETPDTPQNTSLWSYISAEIGTLSLDHHHSLPIAAETTHVVAAVVGGGSNTVQPTLRRPPTPPAMSAVINTTPLGLSGSPLVFVLERSLPVRNFNDLLPSGRRKSPQLKYERQSDGVIALEVQEIDVDNESVQTDAVVQSILPVFSKLGVPDTYEAPFCHTGLNSGGNVKVQTSKQMSLSPSEFIIKQSLLPQLDHTALASVSNPDYASSTEIGSDELDIDLTDFKDVMDMNDVTDIEGLDSMSLAECLTELEQSPLGEETSTVNFTDYDIFGDVAENDTSEIFLTGTYQQDNPNENIGHENIFSQSSIYSEEDFQ